MYADLCSESLLYLSLLIICSFSLIFQCINISSLMMCVGFLVITSFLPLLFGDLFFCLLFFLLDLTMENISFIGCFQRNNLSLVNSFYYVSLFYFTNFCSYHYQLFSSVSFMCNFLLFFWLPEMDIRSLIKFFHSHLFH